MIVELARLFQREARAHLALSDVGTAPYVEQLRVASEDGGTEPYLASFRVSVYDPPCGAHREYTVTITESRSRR